MELIMRSCGREDRIQKANRLVLRQEIGVPNRDRVFLTNSLHKCLNNVIHKARIGIWGTIEMEYGARTPLILAIANHVNVDHRKDAGNVIGVLVKMISEPVMFRSPHKSYRPLGPRKLSC